MKNTRHAHRCRVTFTELLCASGIGHATYTQYYISCSSQTCKQVLLPHFTEEETGSEKTDPFPVSSSLPGCSFRQPQWGGLNDAACCPGRLHKENEAWIAPWITYHAAKISILRANDRVIIIMIRFPCTAQIRCVNIIKNISLCMQTSSRFHPES